MRAMRFFLGFATSSAFVGAIAAGCGSSSSPANNPVDSGPGDVTTEAMTPQPEAATEAGPDVVDAAPEACVPDTSLSSLMLPDAALNDAGATVAGCFACFNQACPLLVQECNASCACIADFQSYANCIGQPGSSALLCLQSLGNLNQVGVDASAFSCGIACLTACGQSLPSGDGGHPEGGGEAGTTEAGGD